jgi:hypothetical protein
MQCLLPLKRETQQRFILDVMTALSAVLNQDRRAPTFREGLFISAQPLPEDSHHTHSLWTVSIGPMGPFPAYVSGNMDKQMI